MEKSLKPETIKNNIERLLKNRSWGQVDLEKRIGGSRNVSNIMRGISKYPTVEVLQRIANAFNVEIGQLLLENHNSQLKAIDYDLLSNSFTKVVSVIQPLESQYKLAPEKWLREK